MCPVKMNAETTVWTRRYRTALRRFLRHGPAARASAAERLGGQAADLGLETMDVAGIHEQALNTGTPPEGSPANATQERIERADTFFKETLVPIEATHRAARNADRRIARLTRTVQRRAEESSATAERVKQATARRQAAEASAEERAGQHEEQLAEAQRMQKRLRHRLHDILAQNESERQQIGGELRDEIAQALLAIDLSLLALNTSGHVNTEKTEKTIANAQGILQEFTTKGLVTGAP